MLVAQDSRTRCLNGNGINNNMSTHNCHYFDENLKFQYYDQTGQIESLANKIVNGTGKCVTYYSQTLSWLQECDLDDVNQRWIYYNNEFFLSLDSTKKLNVEGVTFWSKGSSLPYLPKAIVLIGSQVLHMPLCLQEQATTVSLRYCSDTGGQYWTMTDNGLVKNDHTGTCLSRRDSNFKSTGMQLTLVPCDTADEWHWRDGSLYLDSDEEYLIESDPIGSGQVMMGYIPNERSRGIYQHWFVESKRLSAYHKSTNSIRIRNGASFPMECSFSQLGPIYWGVIYPGKIFAWNHVKYTTVLIFNLTFQTSFLIFIGEEF